MPGRELRRLLLQQAISLRPGGAPHSAGTGRRGAGCGRLLRRHRRVPRGRGGARGEGHFIRSAAVSCGDLPCQHGAQSRAVGHHLPDRGAAQYCCGRNRLLLRAGPRFSHIRHGEPALPDREHRSRRSRERPGQARLHQDGYRGSRGERTARRSGSNPAIPAETGDLGLPQLSRPADHPPAHQADRARLPDPS